ncbi:MAG: multidrug effflux MFS transporter [Proteobacteria bacterium]|nr:multidrug effflux MFS transporter [Pseudomonadota bacterium]
MATNRSRPPRMTQTWVVLLLSLMMGLQPVATDLYLPALPAITSGLGATAVNAQLTLTAMLLAFGLSQLVWGPLSDRFGRRPTLMVGLALFTVAAGAGAMVHTVEQLVVVRCVQGIGMGAVVMCGRALIRDLYNHEDGARVMSQGLTGLGLVACLSPPLGGLIAQYVGWHFTLLTLALYATLTLALVAWRFSETLTAPNPRAFDLGPMMQTWWHIVRHRHFQVYAALSTATYGGLFTFLATSPFVFIQVFGLSPSEYGLALLFQSVSYTGGTFLCRYLLKRMGVQRTLRLGAWLSLGSGAALVLVSLLQLHTATTVSLCYFGFIVAHGIHQPCAQSGTVAPFPKAAGAASALAGCLMMVVVFVNGWWLGLQADGTERILTFGIGFWSVVLAALAWGPVQRLGRVTA